jgi:hypothetical protein
MKNGYTKSSPVIYKSGGYPVQPCLMASMGTVKFHRVITIASDLTIAILTNHTQHSIDVLTLKNVPRRF